MVSWTNKEYDEIKMQIDVLAGLVADLDDENGHVLEVAAGMNG